MKFLFLLSVLFAGLNAHAATTCDANTLVRSEEDWVEMFWSQDRSDAEYYPCTKSMDLEYEIPNGTNWKAGELFKELDLITVAGYRWREQFDSAVVCTVERKWISASPRDDSVLATFTVACKGKSQESLESVKLLPFMELAQKGLAFELRHAGRPMPSGATINNGPILTE